MNNPYNPAQIRFLNDLNERYRAVTKGICMATVGTDADSPAYPCAGPIGYRHAIAERHLRLIADVDEHRIRANGEIGTFAKWQDEDDNLQLRPISRFSAGRWSCQRHDQRFAGIDAEEIDLSEPENLFKAVYRVVLHQSHLTLARWNAHSAGTRTDEGWRHFKETAFETKASHDEAVNAESEWRDVVHAIMGKKRDLEERMARRDWRSLEYRALLLESDPAVAGWGCLMIKFNVNGLHPDDPRKHWGRHIELGYVVVIPQKCGHAIITACEPATRFRVSDIVRIHDHMPYRSNPNQPFRGDGHLKQRISQKIWTLNEIGMRESVYRAWSRARQREVQDWIRNRRAGQHSGDLPNFF